MYSRQDVRINTKITDRETVENLVKPICDFADKHDVSFSLGYNGGNQLVASYEAEGKTSAYCKYNAIPTKKNGKVYWNNPYSLPRDWWEINALPQAHSECVGYDTQKPKKLLERIIKASTNEGDLVADFFCGSGTTCVVAKELGRNYLGCDIGEKAIQTTNQRLKGGEENG